ncbi:MAG: copper-binding protein [Burkholderiaceae bacterium]
MKTFFRQTLVLFALAGSAMAWAQATDHSHHAAPAVQAAAPATDLTDGEVRKLDLDTGKVTLKHGPIKSLDMPPMTMVFTADKALLTPLKVGDKVRFKVVHQGGTYVVTDIQPGL